MICLDPGHHRPGSGCSCNGLDEATYVLDLARRISAELSCRGVSSCLTRTDGAYVSFTERAAIARRNRAKGTIVLHVNAASKRSTIVTPAGVRVPVSVTDPLPHGPMAFHLGVNAPAMEAASTVIRGLGRPGEYVDVFGNLHPMQHQVWVAASGGWREHAWACMFRHDEPVILVECGYASHVGEAAWMLSPEGVGTLSAAIADAAVGMAG